MDGIGADEKGPPVRAGLPCRGVM